MLSMLAANDVQGIVSRLCEAVNSRDAERGAADLDSELELVPLRSATEGPYRGVEGWRAFLIDTFAVFDVFRMEDPRVRELDGGLFLVSCSVVMRSRGAGVDLIQPLANVLELRNGKVLSWVSYASEEEALADAAERRPRHAG
jgi:hypothetical protein